MFDLEDLDGSVRCILWPDEFAVQGSLIQPDALVVLQGLVEFRGGDEPNLVVKQVLPLEKASQQMATGLRLRLRQPDHDEQTLRTVHEITRGYPGPLRLQLEMELDAAYRVELATERRVALDDELLNRLTELLGPGRIEPLFRKPAAIG